MFGWQAQCFRYPFTLSHAHDHHAMVLLSFATNTAHHLASQHITILNIMLDVHDVKFIVQETWSCTAHNLASS